MSGTPRTGIIGGSGFYSVTGAESAESHAVDTPYGQVHVYREQAGETGVWFIPRHGREHSIAPHRINYRANLWALREAGVTRIIAVNAVGGITPSMHPGALVIPDQIIDYTWGREHTYLDGPGALENHVDFTHPYDPALAAMLARTCRELALDTRESAVYGCTQGPRLETTAEVERLRRDGCDIVGMTGMPEAALARELALDYAAVALVVNWAAGITDAAITLADIRRVLDEGMEKIRRIVTRMLAEDLTGQGKSSGSS